ncbi:uncharacterized protein [Drosophila pseudoobscura]|uniref:Uncharacterized protein isoform X1 n=1 Tax=Drosophila pseudoobscura pseudoobscura TaxID=46245 RepID=A0A6I8WBG3_DROPS|nr:uncharacterized protein LOC6900802 isoform X1 [Drosophila pseudoobscura]
MAATVAQRNILDLPYEVLDLIYKKLNSLSDRISLAKADEYLGEAFAFHSRDHFRQVNTYTYFQGDWWPFLLSLCGTHVREFRFSTGHNWSERLVKLVERHCPHLEKVTLCVNNISCKGIRSLVTNASATIKEIDLYVNDSRISEILHEYPDFPQLRKARFCKLSYVDVHSIQKYNTVEDLALQSGSLGHDIPIKLFEITANLKKLRFLKVFHYNLVESGDGDGDGGGDGDALLGMPIPCPNVEYLQMDYCQISMELPLCPKIKSLKISYCISSIEDVLWRFIVKQGGTLEDIEINCRPSLCDSGGFLEILRSCKRLRLIRIQAQKVKFTREVVATMMDILKDNGVTPDRPLRLILYCNAKVFWIAQWLRSNSNRNLISVQEW